MQRREDDADLVDNKHQSFFNQLFCVDSSWIAPTLNQPGKGSVSLDPNYPLVKVLRAWPGHEGDQEEGKNGGRELLSKLPTGVTLPMHATPAIVSIQPLPAGSSRLGRHCLTSLLLSKKTHCPKFGHSLNDFDSNR